MIALQELILIMIQIYAKFVTSLASHALDNQTFNVLHANHLSFSLMFNVFKLVQKEHIKKTINVYFAIYHANHVQDQLQTIVFHVTIKFYSMDIVLTHVQMDII